MVLGNIKKCVTELKEQFKQRIAAIGDAPKLAILQIGNAEATNQCIKNKVEDCKEVGIVVDVYQYSEDITEYELCEAVRLDQEHYNGVVMQLPLPPHIRQKVVVAAIDPQKDIDGARSDSLYISTAPGGIMKYLRACGFDLTDKDVAIIGRSDTAGGPLAAEEVELLTRCALLENVIEAKARKCLKYG